MRAPSTTPAATVRTARRSAHMMLYALMPTKSTARCVGVPRNASSVPRPMAEASAFGRADVHALMNANAVAPMSAKAKYCRLCDAIVGAIIGWSAFETKYSGTTITTSEAREKAMLMR